MTAAAPTTDPPGFAHTGRSGGGGGGDLAVSYWCHECQASVSSLAGDGACPNCHGGFVEETASIAAIAQAARWFASGANAGNSTEVRIARLLDDLHAHLEMVEGLHESMRLAMSGAGALGEEEGRAPLLSPAPPAVLAAVVPVHLDNAELKGMRQAAQCVVCCVDFEASDRLSRLPGCGHVFHDGCVRQWLQRASSCPICRCDLLEAASAVDTPAAASADAAAIAPARSASPASSTALQQGRVRGPRWRPAQPQGPDDGHSEAHGGDDKRASR